jgi:predicted  nucleic acid-binding Zn-ribbon protein
VRAERDGLLKDRPAARKGIPEEPLALYERAHRARGAGLSALEGSYCSACGEGQTRNDVYAVQNRTRSVLCRSCNRILYLS